MSGNYAYEVIAKPDEAAGKRSDRCQHRLICPLCGKCAGLSEDEISPWRRGIEQMNVLSFVSGQSGTWMY